MTERTIMTGVYTYYPGSGPTVYVDSTPLLVEDKGRSAVVRTPEHALRKTRPHIYVPPTPFEAYHHKKKKSNRSLRKNPISNPFGEYYEGVSDTWESVWLPDGLAPSADFPALESLAVTRALQNLKDQNVNYSQAYAERAQTAGLVASSAIRIAKAIGQVRKGNIAKAAAALGVTTKGKAAFSKNTAAIADNWLELQYGWKPLLQDVYGATKNIYDLNHDEPGRYRISVRGHAHNPRKEFINEVSGDTTKYGRYTRKEQVSVRLDYTLENPALAQASALGVTNPAVLAWELLPWSFVADWFIPVGNYLNSLDAALGFSFCGGFATHYMEYQFNEIRTYRTGDIMNYYLVNESKGAAEYWKKISRRTFSHSPLPRFPGFKNPLSLTHMANALALLRGSVR